MYINNAAPVRLFYFVRHGETEWNREGIYQGPHDIPLNESGLAQAKEVAKQFSMLKVDGIFSSPLSRASETAKIISESLGGLHIKSIPEFVECRSEQSARFVLNAKGTEKLPSFEKLIGFEESVEEFLVRIRTGLGKLLQQSNFTLPLVVAHGGTCTGICEILGIKPMKSPNCRLIKFAVNSHGKWQAE